MKRSAPFAAVLAALLLSTVPAAQEHEELGRMWTLEDAPLDFFEETYGFRPSEEWLTHARLSALRYANFCSASFVSPRGLVMTNHHCARGNVQDVTPDGADWLTDGFFAGALEQEVPIPGLTVQQLVATQDVTERMNEGIDADTGEADLKEKLDSNEARILEEAKEAQPELVHQVVSLYQGGIYRLYSYKVYDDLRLVAAPQSQIAAFGGDPDNFTFPRYCLDFALVRAWENGAPADTRNHYFRWRTEGPKDGETVFVLGNPGSTGRLKTIAQIEFLRDIEYPANLARVKSMLAQIEEQSAENPEFAQRMRSRKLQLENARKAFTGYLDGLRNESIVAIKRKAEEEIRDRIAADPELQARFGDAWDRMAELVDKKRAAFEARDQAAFTEASDQEEVLEKRIGEAFFAVYGTAIPPDATMTLRISDGVMAGFPMNGTVAPYVTSLYGLYGRWTEFEHEPPFDLPQNWIDAESKLDLTTRVNHVSTCDIIGGNSGSPVIDTQGQIVGLVFDGNIESLGNNYIFTDDVPRTVSVHPAIIIEALRKVYGAGKIADELEGKGKGYD